MAKHCSSSPNIVISLQRSDTAQTLPTLHALTNRRFFSILNFCDVEVPVFEGSKGRFSVPKREIGLKSAEKSGTHVGKFETDRTFSSATIDIKPTKLQSLIIKVAASVNTSARSLV
jgi:hypothetical protein